MNTTTFAKGTTAEDLRLFLGIWPSLITEAEETRRNFKEDKAKLLGEDAEPFAWCYLYELPIKEHLVAALTSIAHAFSPMLDPQQMVLWLNQLATSQSQAGEIQK